MSGDTASKFLFWPNGLAITDLRAPADVVAEASAEWEENSEGKLALHWEEGAAFQYRLYAECKATGEKVLLQTFHSNTMDAYPIAQSGSPELAKTPAEFAGILARVLSCTTYKIYNLLISRRGLKC